MKPYSTFYGEKVLSFNETNISQEILIAEVSEGNETGEKIASLVDVTQIEAIKGTIFKKMIFF